MSFEMMLSFLQADGHGIRLRYFRSTCVLMALT